MSTQKILAAIIFIVVITQDAYESPGIAHPGRRWLPLRLLSVATEQKDQKETMSLEHDSELLEGQQFNEICKVLMLSKVVFCLFFGLATCLAHDGQCVSSR